MLTLTVIAGSDETLVYRKLRALETQLEAPSIERWDLSSDQVLLGDLLGSASLFDTARYAIVYNLDATSLETVESLAPISSAVILASYTGRLTPKLSARFEALGQLIRVSSPVKAADRTSLLISLARDSGVELSSPIAGDLSELLDGNWARAASIIDQLSMAQIAKPTLSQVTVLAGSSKRRVVPWDITNAASSANTPLALQAACALEPVVLASWLGSETLKLAAVVENSWSASQAASSLDIPPFRAQRLVAWSRQLSPAKTRQAIRAVGQIELAAKAPNAKIAVMVPLTAWLTAVSL
jgi:DNA polymerase III delta subunit